MTSAETRRDQPEGASDQSEGQRARRGMLVLSRRPGQSIFIDIPGTDGTSRRIEVVMLGSDGVQARIGFRADPDVTVLRKELVHRPQPPVVPQQ
jgi:sRNA-binding carbon storage regulator CsrA